MAPVRAMNKVVSCAGLQGACRIAHAGDRSG